MSAARKSALNILFGLFGQIVIILIGIIIPRLVLVGFGSEVNGLINSANQIFIYFSLFEAGIGTACLQALYLPVANGDRKRINGIISATNIFYRRTGILYALSVVIMALVFPFIVKTSLSYGLIVAVILFGGLGGSINFLYEGKYKILMQVEGYSFVVSNITTVVNILINVAKATLLALGYGIVQVQISGFIISILQMLIYLVYVKRKYGWVDLGAEPDMEALSQKNATFIHQLSTMIFANTDLILLTVITKDLKLVSIYSLYSLVTNSLFLLMQQLPEGVNFRMGQLYNTDENRYFPLYHIFEIGYLVLGFAAMTTAYLLFTPFMKLYTAGIADADYINNLYPLFFVLVQILSIGRFAPLYLINHAGHFKKTQWRSVAESVINLIVTIFGIYFFGIIGALMGTVVALFYRTNDMILYSYKHLIHQSPIRTYKRWLGCIAVFIVVVYYIGADRVFAASYFALFGYGAVIGIASLIIYSLIQIVLNYGEVKDAYRIIRGLGWKK